MLSPDSRAHRARRQAETPLSVPCRIPEPALSGGLDRASPCLPLYPLIVLQNSKVAAVDSFGENLKREKIDDSYSLRGATELTYEFGARE